MSKDLVARQPVSLPSVDVRDPSSMLCLPEWLAQQLGGVSDRGQGRVIFDRTSGEPPRIVPTIPASLMPTGAQRQAIATRIDELEDAQRPGPVERTVAIIGEIIAEHATGRMDEMVAGVKTDAFLDALEDLPAWAIREAVRRWRRGEVDGVDPQDFKFAPKPQQLRRAAMLMVNVARGQAVRLQRILDAEAEKPVSADVQQRQSEELARIGIRVGAENHEREQQIRHGQQQDAYAKLKTLRDAEDERQRLRAERYAADPSLGEMPASTILPNAEA